MSDTTEVNLIVKLPAEICQIYGSGGFAYKEKLEEIGIALIDDLAQLRYFGEQSSEGDRLAFSISLDLDKLKEAIALLESFADKASDRIDDLLDNPKS